MNNPVFQLGGVALCLGASTLFFCVRTAITKIFVNYCSTARNTDMADIPSSYEIPPSPSMSDRKGPPAQGPGGFWVAVIESPDHKTSEVVGYLGLDYRVNPDPSAGELRRMMVSMHHRRRKIASLLIAAVLDHAQHLSPPLKTLDLETTEFQPGARKLYESYGFSLVGSRIMRMGPLFSMTMLRLRRRVAE
ncbi:acyl-CoA N-acyltransferase [Mycena epipterygia]|nr:acyl-CoA N-acyltransferase [Mycena epipterygia]